MERWGGGQGSVSGWGKLCIIYCTQIGLLGYAGGESTDPDLQRYCLYNDWLGSLVLWIKPNMLLIGASQPSVLVLMGKWVTDKWVSYCVQPIMTLSSCFKSGGGDLSTLKVPCSLKYHWFHSVGQRKYRSLPLTLSATDWYCRRTSIIGTFWWSCSSPQVIWKCLLTLLGSQQKNHSMGL